jgi:putative salt-induced outer membrane protein
MSKPLVLLVPLALVLSTLPSRAQEKPAGLMQQPAATSGSTEVASSGFEAPGERTEESVDATELSLSAGALLSAGNSRSVALTSAGRFRLRRGAKQLSAAAGTNYGQSAADRDAPLEKTVENYQARVRYDYFVTRHVALFLGTSVRRDRFQGLNWRFNVDPGVAYYFVDHEKYRFWTELGYDLQHDVRSQRAINDAAAAGSIVDRTETRHHARAFLGYENSVSRAVTLNTGLEYLQGLAPFRDDVTDHVNWRLNWDLGVTSAITDSLAIATTLSIKYDHNPLPEVARADAVSALSLVYEML